MKLGLPAVLSCLLLAMSFLLHAAGPAEGHSHHGHESSEPKKLKLDAGKKWTTDAPLRQAMGEINQAMAKAVPLIHRNQFGDGEYRALAQTVRHKIAYAVEHCNLDQKADEMLHLVIADLLAGAEAMEGTKANSQHDGAAQILKALRGYGSHFHHPGWKPAGV